VGHLHSLCSAAANRAAKSPRDISWSKSLRRSYPPAGAIAARESEYLCQPINSRSNLSSRSVKPIGIRAGLSLSSRPRGAPQQRRISPAELLARGEYFKQRLLGIRSRARRIPICRWRRLPLRRSGLSRRRIRARRTRRRLGLGFSRAAENVSQRLFRIGQRVAVVAGRGWRRGCDSRRRCTRDRRRGRVLLVGPSGLLSRRRRAALLPGTWRIRRRRDVVLRRSRRWSVTRLTRRWSVRLPRGRVGAGRVRNVSVLLRRARAAGRDQGLLRIARAGGGGTLVRIRGALEHIGKRLLRIDRRPRRRRVRIRVAEGFQETGVRAGDRTNRAIG
jgi:hypothetical protein